MTIHSLSMSLDGLRLPKREEQKVRKCFVLYYDIFAFLILLIIYTHYPSIPPRPIFVLSDRNAIRP